MKGFNGAGQTSDQKELAEIAAREIREAASMGLARHLTRKMNMMKAYSTSTDMLQWGWPDI